VQGFIIVVTSCVARSMGIRMCVMGVGCMEEASLFEFV